MKRTLIAAAAATLASSFLFATPAAAAYGSYGQAPSTQSNSAQTLEHRGDRSHTVQSDGLGRAVGKLFCNGWGIWC